MIRRRLAELDQKLIHPRARMDGRAQELLLPRDASPSAIHAQIQEFAGLRDLSNASAFVRTQEALISKYQARCAA